MAISFWINKRMGVSVPVKRGWTRWRMGCVSMGERWGEMRWENNMKVSWTVTWKGGKREKNAKSSMVVDDQFRKGNNITKDVDNLDSRHHMTCIMDTTNMVKRQAGNASSCHHVWHSVWQATIVWEMEQHMALHAAWMEICAASFTSDSIAGMTHAWQTWNAETRFSNIPPNALQVMNIWV